MIKRINNHKYHITELAMVLLILGDILDLEVNDKVLALLRKNGLIATKRVQNNRG